MQLLAGEAWPCGGPQVIVVLGPVVHAPRTSSGGKDKMAALLKASQGCIALQWLELLELRRSGVLSSTCAAQPCGGRPAGAGEQLWGWPVVGRVPAAPSLPARPRLQCLRLMARGSRDLLPPPPCVSCALTDGSLPPPRSHSRALAPEPYAPSADVEVAQWHHPQHPQRHCVS